MDKEPVVAEEKRQKIIKVFGRSFTIVSTPKLAPQQSQIGWEVTVSFVAESDPANSFANSLSPRKITKKESYIEYVKDRLYAEEACFGYFLIKHCQGGIYYSNIPEGDK